MTTPPAPCHATGKDEPNGAPYFVEKILMGKVEHGPGGVRIHPRVRPVVHASSWIKMICDSPGSPFVALTHAEHARLADRDELALRVEELEAENAALRESQTSVDVQALASALVPTLSSHFSQKTGPKPKVPA